MKILDDLESKAKAATPGPWIIQERRVPLGKCIETIDESILKMDEDELVACAEYSSEDAKYIASVSPDVVLKLLAVVRAAIELGENSAKAPIHAWKPLEKALELFKEQGK